MDNNNTFNRDYFKMAVDLAKLEAQHGTARIKMALNIMQRRRLQTDIDWDAWSPEVYPVVDRCGEYTLAQYPHIEGGVAWGVCGPSGDVDYMSQSRDQAEMWMHDAAWADKEDV
jgi:hypothetical protein